MGKLVDLTGRKFGHFTVVKLDEERMKERKLMGKPREIFWLCKCDCKNETIRSVRGRDVRHSTTMSCGCVSTQGNITGKIFGKLKVIRRAEDFITSKGKIRTQWICKCDCGNPNELIILKSKLTGGFIDSCGCTKKSKIGVKLNRINEYVLSGEYGIGYTSKEQPFYFDLEDYDKIKNYTWYYDKKGYVVANGGKNKNIRMHRIVLGMEGGKKVDHIHHIHHDNRKNELRLVTDSQNGMNMLTRSDNLCGETGVCYNSRDNTWRAHITKQGKRIFKTFKTKEEAVACRKNLEAIYYKEYACTNTQYIKGGVVNG